MKKYLFYGKWKFALLTLLKLVYAALYVGFALMLQWLVNLVTAEDATVRGLLTGVGILTAYVAVFAGVLLFKDKMTAIYANVAMRRMCDDMTKRLLEERYEDFARHDTAKYLSHLTNDIKTLSASYFNATLTLPEEIFTFVFAVMAAFTINYVVALTMLGLTLLIFIVPVAFNKPLNRANIAMSEAVKDYTAILKQAFLGMDVIKNFGSEERMQRDIAEVNRTLTKKNTWMNKLNLYAGDVGICIIVLLQLGSIAVSGYMLIEGVILIGAVIAVVQLSGNMYGPLMQVAGKAALISGVRELNATLLAIAEEPEADGAEIDFRDEIRAENLVFAYGDAETPILRGVDAVFRKGKKYLIVGKSGSGKSTLLKLLGKTYRGYAGRITLDGVDYRDFSERQFYRRAAFAQQKSYLFERSVRDNIDFNRTGDETLLRRAIEVADLSAFVAAQKDGWDEIVGEEGKQISGGEKQRIGLARAVYQDSELFLLDEVTSSLDKETAHRVEENVLSLRDKTVISVSHKLHADLIGRYDGICIMENGRVVDFDTPEKLTAQRKLDQFFTAENANSADA